LDIPGKVFAVTGGGNGIGREVVLELLRRGARVAALDLSEDGLAGTAELADAGERLYTRSVNVTDRAAVEDLPKVIANALGEVDGLINVAGIVHRFAPLHELSYDELERVINVNFWGTVITSKTFLPGLLQRPQASLVNVSSQGGLAAIPGQSGYGASKAAVKLLTECITGETRGSNLAVTIVFPGGINTNLLDNSGITTGTDPLKAENAAMKLTTAIDAGRQIVDAIAKGTQRVRIGNDAKLLDRLTRLMPAKSVGAIADKMKGLME
jgi:NAD(P)-dependent dehydrogenase (short-subunit alcohol dehydrogenase family)